MKFPGGLSTDNNVRWHQTVRPDDNDGQHDNMTHDKHKTTMPDEDNDTRRTVHDCIGSLAFMPNEPNIV